MAGRKHGKKPRALESPPAGDSKVPPEAEKDAQESFWTELGLPEPEFLDDSLAPTVNRDLLRKLVLGELDPELEKLLYRLVEAFPCWHAAHSEIAAEEARRTGEIDRV